MCGHQCGCALPTEREESVGGGALEEEGDGGEDELCREGHEEDEHRLGMGGGEAGDEAPPDAQADPTADQPQQQ